MCQKGANIYKTETNLLRGSIVTPEDLKIMTRIWNALLGVTNLASLTLSDTNVI